MTTTPSVRARRVGSGGVIGALVASSLLLAPSAAQADSTTVVKGAEIAPDESTYAGWHQGAANASGRYGVSSKGLQQVGKSQVIRGYQDNDNANLKEGGVNADVSALIGATYDVTDGRAYFQLPLFVDDDGSARTAGVFATLRPVEGATGATTIDGDDLWTVSRNIPGVGANTPIPLEDLVAAVDDRSYKTIGFGTFTDTGDTSTVSSISFAGQSYSFVADTATSTTVRNADVKGVEAGNYTSWHQGYDNASGRQFVGVDGLELEGKSQVIKGFENNDAALNAVNASLASVLDDASYTVAEGSDDVFFQIPLRSDAIAGNQFTTLRASVAGAGTHALAGLTWQANKAIGSIPANTERPIADVVAELGTYKVIGYGVLTVPGTSAVVSNVTFAGQSFDFRDEPVAAADTTNVLERDIAADETVYEGWHQGAATNTARIVEGALALGADRSQIIKGYANNTDILDGKNANLPDVLRSASYTVSAGTVHFQLPMFFEDPETGRTTFTTLRTTAPADQGVNTFNRLQEWTSSKAIGGVVQANGSVRMGEILAALPDYKVLAFGVYADAGAGGVVKDITWDGTTYTFVDADPTAAAVSATTRAGDPVDVTLKGADDQPEAVTYTVGTAGHGTVTVDGDVATYTPESGFTGEDTFTYAVGDGGFNTVEGVATVTVAANAAPVVTPGQTGTARAGGDRGAVIKLAATDAENDAIASFQLVGQPENGTAIVFPDGRLVVIPDEDVAAEADDTVTVQVTATDSRGATSAPADVTVAIKANKAPAVMDVERSVRANKSTTVDLVATDPEGDAVTFTVGEATNGTVSLSGNTVTYQNTGTSGTDSFTYTATDERGGKSTGTVNVTVNANNNPVAKDASASTTSGKAVTVQLAATDADGDQLTYAATGTGVSVNATTGKLTYTPGRTFAGTASIGYTVSDGEGGSDTGVVKVTVKAVAVTSFTVSPSAPTTKSTIKLSIRVVAPAGSVNGGVVTVFDGSKKLGTGKLSSTGRLTYTVGKLKKGTHSLKVSFGGTSTVVADSETRTVKVK